jgi:hypothetical protein
MNCHKTISRSRQVMHLVIIIVVTSLIGIYPIIRYRGQFTRGGDASSFLRSTAAIADQARLVPDSRVYPNGYAYQFLILSLSSVLGLQLGQAQVFVGYLLLAWPFVLSWLFYREVLDTLYGAFWASAILFAQPDFLFPLMRGTHEKFTRGLIFLALYLLARNLRRQRELSHLFGTTISFYLTIFALMAMNSLFTTSLVTGLCLAGVLIWITSRYLDSQDDSGAGNRPLYMAGTSLVVSLTFILFLYEPAKESILLLDSVARKVAAVLLGTETELSEPYAVIGYQWASSVLYPLLVLPTLATLAGSAAIWLAETTAILRRRNDPGGRRLLLLALYAVFAALLAASAVVDRIGAFHTTNLQIRSLPTLLMLAAPVCAGWLLTAVGKSSVHHTIASAMLIAGLGLSVIKATNDPLVSKRFPCYSQTEVQAINWVQRLPMEQWLWVGPDNRLQSEMANRVCAEPDKALLLDIGDVDGYARDLLISDLLRVQARRIDLGLPLEPDSLRVYDNGRTEIYHLRPRTPFQR